MKNTTFNIQTGETTETVIADISATDAEALANLRSRRNLLLSETDYLALADHTLTDAMKTYRQQLRDLPDNTADPHNVTYPTKPS
jgi:phage tail sheath protein FI|tara:strand:- start:52 stop:306 length:255 start_codon:yes stop_codon:yes gene_type:complete